MAKHKIIFLFLVSFFLNVFPQGNLPPGTYTSSNKKAIKFYEEGKKYYEVRRDKEAEEVLKKALKEDDNFVEAHSALAYLLMGYNRSEEAIVHFEKAVAINAKFYPQNIYFLANAYMSVGKYDDAIKSYEMLSKFDRISPATKEAAAKELINAKFGSQAVKNPKPFKPVNMGPGVNTNFAEYFPSITADGKQFLFTREIVLSEMSRQEDFYLSKKENTNSEWKDAMPVVGVNTMGNEGAPSISADGNFMFFASCMEQSGDYGSPDRKGYGSCDIFYSQKRDGKWTKPVNIGPTVNTANWETQPSFSSDGKTLYFVRGLISRGAIKEQDIYMSVIGADGKFGAPVKLSDKINTPEQEESVFIHPDNQTLYFSSAGHPGMGGLDIFMSRRQPDGSWGEAINLGYPINTYATDNSLLVDPAGKLAYFASDRAGGFGALDIYQFELPEDVRPEKLTYVKGKTYNAKTKIPLSAKFELIDLETQQSVTESYSDNAGQFLVTLTGNKNYIVNVSKDGYLFYSDNFSLKGKETDFNKPYLLDIPLQPIDTGSVVELKNVFFDVDKWELKPESKAELDKLVFFLNKNPSVKIELGGHTDNSGKKEWNKTLSTNRAKSVYDYILTNGKIAATRLSFKGYAETKPKVPNDTPENKAKNRRTEFKVTGK
ncbi:MAG: PD40 domain-containing protein [Bacteroidia bacterium]|nr:PD40 domain-containing protein [Bacteroidia bacterium]